MCGHNLSRNPFFLFKGATLGELLVVLPFLALTAAMMFPLLGGARERARRTQCMNHLNQISMGMEMYLGLYGDYYPGRMNYGIHESTRFGDGGRGRFGVPAIRGRKTQHVFDFNPSWGWERGDARYRMTTIGAGHYEGDLKSDDLKVAPVGLGFLLVVGAIPTSEPFCCPSAPGVSIDDTYSHSGHPAHRFAMLDPNDNLGDWVEAGGMDGRMLTHGKWQKRSANNRISVLSQYNYRNQPAYAAATWEEEADLRISDPLNRFTVAYTSPKVVAGNGAPLFKTPRILRSRALVSDSFAKGPDMVDPGFGYYAHNEGYNVAYGDYSVRWYGDRDQKIIYWDVLSYPADWNHSSGTNSLMSNTHYWHGRYFDAQSGKHRDASLPSVVERGVPRIWHEWDTFAGVDIGAPAHDGVDTLR